MTYELIHPDFLVITCNEGETAMGGSQNWYPNRRERMSGCGPTNASNLIWYLAQSRPELQIPCETAGGAKHCFVGLMQEMFAYVTPGIGGVNNSSIFTDGISRYALAHGFALSPQVLDIPASFRKRPAADSVYGFIVNALQADSPVAFLNRSNGKLKKLDNWHWVTIIGFEKPAATIIDQGSAFEICLGDWLKTSLLGGTFVYVCHQAQA